MRPFKFSDGGTTAQHVAAMNETRCEPEIQTPAQENLMNVSATPVASLGTPVTKPAPAAPRKSVKVVSAKTPKAATKPAPKAKATPAKKPAAKAPSKPAKAQPLAALPLAALPKKVVKPTKPAKKAKAHVTGYTIEKNRKTSHGYTRPSAGTICGKWWDTLDKMANGKPKTVAIADARVKAEKGGVDATTATVQFYRWRRFHGVEGRQ